jgi:hypothetical protein
MGEEEDLSQPIVSWSITKNKDIVPVSHVVAT